MKKYIFMAVAAIAALSSCSSDNDPIVRETGKQALTFTASMESDATRATYNSTVKCAQWEVGDQISINGKTYNAQSADLTTTFKAATVGQEAEGPTYNAYFACTYDGTTATLPAEVSETWADGKFNMPMYATSTTTNLQFKNLCGVLKITVPSSQIAAVKKIKVSSANKAVSGAFTVDANNAAVLTNACAVANTLTMTYTAAVPTTAGGTVFYVAVPAQAYQKLSISLSANGTSFTKIMTTKSDADITVARNMIYPITFADNAPTTGTAEATIGGSTVDVNWVQLWENGPRFAEYNVGASSATDRGTEKTFTEATADPFIWGANWCTPSKDDMDELLKAATKAGSEKVACTSAYQNGTYGFRFTGKKAGYTENTVFFPAPGGSAYYWSGTPNGSEAWCMSLSYISGVGWMSDWFSFSQNDGCLVRPVLSSTGDPSNGPTPFNVTFSDFSYSETTATASNNDVTVTLTLSSTSSATPKWDRRQISEYENDDEGTMTINVTPKKSGITVAGIVYDGGGYQTTKTGTGPWNFTIRYNRVYDGDKPLGSLLMSVTVNYTK